MLLKALLIWVGIAVAETIQGILRVRLLNPRLGDRGARRAGVFTGGAIILAIGWYSIAWIGPGSSRECLLVGALWLMLMLSFDIGLGRWVLHLSWSRIASDFDLRRGNLLAIGMIILFLTPLLVAKLRGLY